MEHAMLGTKRALKKLAVLLMLVSPAAAAQSAEPSWDKTLAAARKEGKVVVVGAPDPVMRNEVIPAFERRFPGIKVDYIAGRSADIVERVKLERLQAIAIEAAEQCGRTVLPEIDEPVPLARLLEQRDPARTRYFADEAGGEPAANAFKPGAAMILTGPEGGFTDEERAAIRAASNSLPVSLGPRILRAETAALAALATYMAVAGDWRG